MDGLRFVLTKIQQKISEDRKPIAIIALVVLALSFFATADFGNSANRGATDFVPKVVLSECKSPADLSPRVNISVVNTSAETRNFRVEVRFEKMDGSIQYGMGSARMFQVKPGATAVDVVISEGISNLGGELSCRLVSAESEVYVP